MDLSDPETAAMAAAMGFSSFGAQEGHPSKKRRYNPRADAASDAVEAAPYAASGANDVPIASRAPHNADEIDLGDDGDDAHDEPAVPTIDGPALAYTQKQIDELLAQPDDANGAPEVGTAPAPGGAGNGVALPSRPNPSWGQGRHGSAPQRGGGRGNGNGQQQRPRDGEPSKPWWEGYHDPRSNENPWRELEAAAGLQPLGSWVLKGAVSG